MTGREKSLVELTNQAIAILTRELGSADTIRFINQFTTGHGDYTAEREEILGPMTLSQITAVINAGRDIPPQAESAP